MTVTATDQAVDPLIGICQLNILILDQNDNSPKFENIRYECKSTGFMLETTKLAIFKAVPVNVSSRSNKNFYCELFVLFSDFLREDTMIGNSFLRVAAHDDDFGTNAAITYSMSTEEPEYLRVNPLTGWVYVNQPISQVKTICSIFSCIYLVLQMRKNTILLLLPVLNLFKHICI